MNQPVRSPFVDSLPAAETLAGLPGSGVAWLDAARRENLDAFVDAGLPDTRVEAWKYTALRALAQRRFAHGDAHAASRAVDVAALALPGVDGPRLVFVNGVFRADLSSLTDLPAGLSLRPLSQALREDAEGLRFALSHRYREAGDAFARLNAALATDGVVLRVAAGTAVARPVHLLFVGAPAENDLALHLRNVVELEEGAELSLVEHYAAGGPQKHLATVVGDVVLRDGAKLDYTLLQDAA